MNNLINMQLAKDRIARQYKDEELNLLLLFKGNQTFGRMQSLFKNLLIMKDTGIVSISDWTRISREENDLSHFCGIHSKSAITYGSILSFLSRLKQSEEVLNLENNLEEFIDFLTKRRYLLLEKTPRWSSRTRRSFRYKPGLLKSYYKPTIKVKPIPEYYPFIEGEPTEDHNLVMKVHNSVPKGIPENVRQDICQDLIVAVLSGEISVENIPNKLKDFTKKAWKMYPSKYIFSLDQPLYRDSDRTLLDLLSDDNSLSAEDQCEKDGL